MSTDIAKQIHSGQTLVEVMVALFVLVTGFLGILSLLAQSLALSKTVSNETIATYLASEGIELAKNLIDHDIYQNLAGYGGWGKNQGEPTFPSGGYDYQLDYTTFENCQYSLPCGSAPQYTGQPLGFDPSTGLYSYGGPVVTGFTREIKAILDPTDLNEITIQSIVSWSEGPFDTQSVQLEDVFYNWQP